MPTVAQLISNKAQNLNQDNLILGPMFLTITLHCLSVRLGRRGKEGKQVEKESGKECGDELHLDPKDEQGKEGHSQKQQ